MKRVLKPVVALVGIIAMAVVMFAPFTALGIFLKVIALIVALVCGAIVTIQYYAALTHDSTAVSQRYEYVSKAEFFLRSSKDKRFNAWVRVRMRFNFYMFVLVSTVCEVVFLFMLTYALWVLWCLLAGVPLFARIILELAGVAAWVQWIRWRIKKHVSFWRKPALPYPI